MCITDCIIVLECTNIACQKTVFQRDVIFCKTWILKDILSLIHDNKCGPRIKDELFTNIIKTWKEHSYSIAAGLGLQFPFFSLLAQERLFVSLEPDLPLKHFDKHVRKFFANGLAIFPISHQWFLTNFRIQKILSKAVDLTATFSRVDVRYFFVCENLVTIQATHNKQLLWFLCACCFAYFPP